MDFEQRNRIPASTARAMLAIALVFDLIGVIPLVNILSTIATWIIFPVWFWRRGAKFTKSPKMIGYSAVSFVVGLIPLINKILPELFLGVYMNIRLIKKEDAAYNKAQERSIKQQQNRSITRPNRRVR